MVIVYIMGGTGNQLYQYAAGRRLAHKLKTELKLDLTFYEHDNLRPYSLNLFNIKESIATPEEISAMKKVMEPQSDIFVPEVLNCPDNVWLHGYWSYEDYFSDITDILRRELTLKNSLTPTAQRWKEKILATKTSVSLHIRHGDFVYSPVNQNMTKYFAIAPLSYYYKCIEILKREYKNLTLFVFSDNLKWCKENIRVGGGITIEFVEGKGMQDVEELYLMSLCKHNIRSKSTFSWWGAWLNQNPNKKVFCPMSNLEPIPSKLTNKKLDSDKWIRVTFDINSQSEVILRPWFSLLIVVNDDAATLVESLNSLIGQDYKYFELIIVDNASTDGSIKICRKAEKDFDNVTLIKLHSRVSNGAAWNIALKAAQGYFVMFLKGSDRLLSNALTSLYLMNEHIVADVVNSTAYLKEDERNNINPSEKKFFLNKMSAFENMNGIFRNKLDKLTLLKILSNDKSFFPLGTRLFSRKFLEENKISFDEKIDGSENLFVIDALFKTEEIIFTSQPTYIAPSN